MSKKMRFAVFTLCCAFVAGCAPMNSSGPSLEERVQQQDMQLRQMQPQQADTWNQVQAMKQEISDLKRQLTAMQGGLPADSPLVQPPNETGDAPLTQGQFRMAPAGLPMTGLGSAYSPDSSAYGAARTEQPQPTGSYGLPPDGAQTGQRSGPEVVEAPSEETWGKADPQPVLQTPQKDISLALFDAGVNDYNARRYQEAERSFTDFLKNYPNHSQTAEAQFYVAECDFQRNQFAKAALAYDVVIKKYPKSSSAPQAYLKQAICFSKMNEGAAARARMQEVINKFPNSPEAARAKTFLKTNK